MQSYVIFTCALTLLLTSLHVLAQETQQMAVSDDLVDTCTLVQLQMSTSRDKHQLRDVTNNLATLHDKNLLLNQQFSQCKSQHTRLQEEFKSQMSGLQKLQVESDTCKDMMRQFSESGKTIESLSQENGKLKQQLQETQFCKDAVLMQLRSLTLELETHKSDFTTEVGAVKSLINSKSVQSDNMVTDNIAKVLSVLSQMSADIQAVSKSVIGDKTCQTQNVQILSQLEAQDSALASVTKKLTCEIQSRGLNTKTLNGKTYYFSYDQPRMTWYEADNFCHSHGMHLVSVETREEWDLLKPEVKKLNNKIGEWPWSSGSDAAEEGKWKWTATGSDVIFFAPKYRSMDKVASENCMILYTDWWNDYPCTDKRPFICKVNSPC